MLTGLLVTNRLAASRVHNDLPILEFPSEGTQDYFVVLFSGDGGWKSIDQSIVNNLNSRKIPVVALNLMKYLWSEKSPLQIAKDLEWIIDTYSKKWNKSNVIIIGYSLGADVLPFTVNCLNSYYLPKIKDLVLIAPSQKTIFKIKLKNYLVDDESGKELIPELKKLKIKNVYCICDDKKSSICKKGIDGLVDYTVLTGGHHFDGDYTSLNLLINNRIKLD